MLTYLYDLLNRDVKEILMRIQSLAPSHPDTDVFRLHATDRVMTPLFSSFLLLMPVFSIMTGIVYTGSL